MLERRLQIILTLLLWATGQCFAQSKDSIIKAITAKYQFIESQRNLYDVEVHELFYEPNGFGQIASFADSNNLKLIEINVPTDNDYKRTTFYFDNGKLIFAIETYLKYNRPIYLDSKIAKENNDTIVFDPNKTIEEKNSYYFFNEKLIGWVYPDEKELNKLGRTNSDLAQRMIEASGQRIIEEANSIKEKMRK